MIVISKAISKRLIQYFMTPQIKLVVMYGCCFSLWTDKHYLIIYIIIITVSPDDEHPFTVLGFFHVNKDTGVFLKTSHI